MNIILFGPPGAGKGTQANKIVQTFNLYKVSTGDLLRNEIKKNNNLSDEIKNKINQGFLAPDNVINELIIKVLSNKKFFNRLIFDGYPRNINQAIRLENLFKKYKQKISCVLCLKVDRETIITRISGRQTCSKCGLIFNKDFKPATTINHTCDPKFLINRSDDNEKIIISRFDTYLTKTLPILDFYKEQNLLHQINGLAEIDQIFEEIRGILSSLEA